MTHAVMGLTIGYLGAPTQDADEVLDRTALCLMVPLREFGAGAYATCMPVRLEPNPTTHRRLMEGLQRHLRRDLRIIADVTAAGLPIAEALRDALEVAITPVVVTSEENAPRGCEGGTVVPKRELIASAQALRMLGKLDPEFVPLEREVRALLGELDAYQIPVAGREPWRRDNEHEDLLLAISLAAWGVRRAILGRDGDGQ